ncbi:MAG: hypothetical protein J5642_03105 [Bacteroidales bacterium]|nr:hypothetical protein [Bacteroidales bacterium]
MEEFDPETIPQEDSPRRRPMLVVLCILTFVNSGFSALSYLGMPLVKNELPAMADVYGRMGMEDAYEQISTTLDFMAEVPSWKYFLLALCYVLAVVGAALMLKMKPSGFHCYVIAQILTFAGLNFLIGGPLSMQLMDVIWSITFVVFYFVLLREVLITPRKESE